MKHFIITRNLYKADYPNKKERADLLRHVTIPSLRHQTNKDFTWVLTGREGLSKSDLADIDFIVEPKYVPYISTNTEADEKILTTRLDNDDLLLPNFVEDTQRLALERDEALIDCPGYRIDIRYQKIYEDTFYRKVPSPFLSVVENKRCKRCRIRSAYYDEHTLMHYHFPVLRGRAAGWVQLIHGTNKVMSRPEEVIDERGKLLDIPYSVFLEQIGLSSLQHVAPVVGSAGGGTTRAEPTTIEGSSAS